MSMTKICVVGATRKKMRLGEGDVKIGKISFFIPPLCKAFRRALLCRSPRTFRKL